MFETATAAVKGAVSSVTSLVSDDKDMTPKGVMHNYLEQSPVPPAEGDIVEGVVSAIGRAKV